MRLRSATAPATAVAPRAGAWIETLVALMTTETYHASRPARARGLKLAGMDNPPKVRTSRPARARGLKPSVAPSA